MSTDCFHLRTWRPVRCAALALAASAAPMLHSQPAADLDGSKAVSVEELKSAYVRCSRAALGGELSAPEIMRCSVVYEELKRRAFDGDFLKLHAWSKAHRAAPGTGL